MTIHCNGYNTNCTQNHKTPEECLRSDCAVRKAWSIFDVIAYVQKTEKPVEFTNVIHEDGTEETINLKIK